MSSRTPSITRVHRKYYSAPPCAERKPSQTSTVFVKLPSGEVCTLRNVPRPGSLDWMKCHIELQTGYVADVFDLKYTDGSLVDDNLPAIWYNPDTAIVLKLQVRERFEMLLKAVIGNDWKNLKDHLLASVGEESPEQLSKYQPGKDNSVIVEEREEPPLNVKFCSLFLASNMGLDNLCKQLLENDDMGIVNKRTIYGHTALHTTVCNDHSSLVKILLDHAADPSLTDNWGQTPLQVALKKCARQCVLVLRFSKLQPNSNQVSGSGDSKTNDSIKHTVTFKDCHTMENSDEGKGGQLEESTKYLFSSYALIHKVKMKFLNQLQSDPMSGGVQGAVESPGRQRIPSERPDWTIQRGLSLDENNLYCRNLQKSSFRLLQKSRPYSASTVYANPLKSVEFLVGSGREALGELHGSCPSPRSPRSGSGRSETSSDGEDTLDDHTSRPGSGVSTSSRDRQRISSATSSNSRKTNCRSPFRQAPKTKWLSAKKKLRLAYLLKKALETKTGQNDAAFKEWLEKKEAKRQRLKINKKTTDTNQDKAEENERAFQKWIHAKNTEPKNYRVFRGLYQSAFIIGSTMAGEPKYPDIMENKDSYKNWRESRHSPALDSDVPDTCEDFRKSKAFKDLEARKQKMLTSAVTYEEWMDCKHLEETLNKELETLKIREKQKHISKTLITKSFDQSKYDKWTRGYQRKSKKVKFSTPKTNSIRSKSSISIVKN